MSSLSAMFGGCLGLASDHSHSCPEFGHGPCFICDDLEKGGGKDVVPQV
jgi:hypothetical protein